MCCTAPDAVHLRRSYVVYVGNGRCWSCRSGYERLSAYVDSRLRESTARNGRSDISSPSTLQPGQVLPYSSLWHSPRILVATSCSVAVSIFPWSFLRDKKKGKTYIIGSLSPEYKRTMSGEGLASSLQILARRLRSFSLRLKLLVSKCPGWAAT
ncbi:hypothetical protein BT67DRAFT_299054 [Trichocladium antarcticum]|uniref:Uncharacterized protein n=1 Tax=Trichocladium antarcticum TaxID=1450529 RepID=A0AAN6UKA6_9PEZI|nr:hypothetical protein BT67DRAFT_299054 [Trichocladium antarcticum]